MTDNSVQYAEKLVEAYVNNRDELERMKKAYDAAKAPLEEQQERIELALNKILQDSNLENLKTAFGTASPHKKTTVNVANWEETLKFIQTKEMWHLLNKAVSKTAVEEYMKENGDIPPPGINYQEFKTIQIRRARAK